MLASKLKNNGLNGSSLKLLKQTTL